jgi:hypothetical protein
VGDYFTKLTELYAMPDMKAETVADIILRAWIKRYRAGSKMRTLWSGIREPEEFEETL